MMQRKVISPQRETLSTKQGSYDYLQHTCGHGAAGAQKPSLAGGGIFMYTGKESAGKNQPLPHL
jgi:hypothetical protein